MRQRIDYLDGMRGIAIFLVVGVHAYAYADVEVSLFSVSGFFLQGIAVPVFFFVDGYLFSLIYRSREFKYRSYLAKSAKRLLIPWLFFSAVYFLIRYLGEVGGIFSTEVIHGQDWGNILSLIYGSGVSSQLYFLLSLFALRITTVVMQYLIEVKVFFIVFISVIYISLFQILDVQNLSSVSLDPLVHTLWGAQFYFLGMLVQKLETSGNNVSIQMVLVAMAAGIYLLSGSAFAVLQVSYLLAAYYLCKHVFNKSVGLIAIGKETMGIYILHMPIIIYCVTLSVKLMAEDKIIMPIIIWIATFIVSYFVSSYFSYTRIGKFVFAANRS
jgi:fucose 4-O-acetylase-like acetyltransferase